MTGYGSYEIKDHVCSQAWEIKSVNSKQLSLRWNIPKFLVSFEPVLEQEIRSVAIRGRVEIYLQLQFIESGVIPVQFNRSMAEAMLSQLKKLAFHYGDEFRPDYNMFLNLSSLWQEASVPAQDELGQKLVAGLKEALKNWDRSRIQEGAALKNDLLARVEKLGKYIADIEAQAKNLPEEKFQTLQDRILSLLGNTNHQLDKERMWQELALLSDKLDVSEELTRLKTHLQAIPQILQSEQAGGRKLDFFLQECFREINTCGNKAQDALVSQHVVDFKTELEKCREQAQNLE